jgi:hypothetical protein
VPYNEELAEKLRGQLDSVEQVTEQEMFGGISFLIAGNMCCGVLGDDVVVRIDPTLHHDALTRPGVSEFEMGGRTSKGMVRVGPAGTADELDLALWVRLGVTYASSMPSKRAQKAAANKRTTAAKKTAARKRKTTAPAKKAPGRKKTTPKKTAPAKKKAAIKKRPPTVPSKKRAAKKTAATKRSSPAGKKAKKATRAKKVTKAKKAPRTRK